jgi:hypothetical protein
LIFLAEMDSFPAAPVRTTPREKSMSTKNRSPQESVKERVARHLRAADIMVKESHFSEAVVQIEVALQLDPKNYYSRSFLDRARAQMEKAQAKPIEPTEEKDTKAAKEDQRIEQISILLRAADQFIAAKKYKLAQQQVRRSLPSIHRTTTPKRMMSASAS